MGRFNQGSVAVTVVGRYGRVAGNELAFGPGQSVVVGVACDEVNVVGQVAVAVVALVGYGDDAAVEASSFWWRNTSMAGMRQ